MRGYRTGACFLIGMTLLASLAWGGDAITEAKRKAAADLMKEGKTADAIAMIGEVIKVDPENYKDHLLLARGYDKLNKAQEAVEEYQKVLEMGGNEERTVKAEAERRLKLLDAQSSKVQALEEEFLKKLEALERDAILARDMRALQQIFALRGGIWNARGRKEGFGVDLPAATAEWFDSGAIVTKGVKYHVRVAGYWTIAGLGRCTADGIDTVPPANINGKYGIILGAVEGGGRYEKFTSDSTFVAPATGRLTLVSNVKTREEREKCSGRLYLLFQPVNN